jgi:hypothetical protein
MGRVPNRRLSLRTGAEHGGLRAAPPRCEIQRDDQLLSVWRASAKFVTHAPAAVVGGGGSSIATRIARIPRLRAGAMSATSEFPTIMQWRGSDADVSNAAANILSSGFAHPTSTEVTQ